MALLTSRKSQQMSTLKILDDFHSKWLAIHRWENQEVTDTLGFWTQPGVLPTGLPWNPQNGMQWIHFCFESRHLKNDCVCVVACACTRVYARVCDVCGVCACVCTQVVSLCTGSWSHVEVRGGTLVSWSIAFSFRHSRQGLSGNLGLGWWRANPSYPPVSTKHPSPSTGRCYKYKND